MSKRLPYPMIKRDDKTPRLWRSLRERDESPEFLDSLHAEFPESATQPPVPPEDVDEGGVSRRSFFRYMGASVALSGLAACRRPEERIVPYSKAPEEIIPGNPVYFATAMPWNGSALGVLVESHEGRPTKVEGNPKHPESGGGTHAFAQAAVLELYDPDRTDQAYEGGTPRPPEAADVALRALRTKYAATQGRGLAVVTEGHRSPSLQQALAALKQALPAVELVRFEPFSREVSRQGAQAVFGRALEAVYDLARAKVIVSLDSDFMHFEGSGVRHAGAWAQGRSSRDPRQMNRLYAIESRHSVSGSAADHRLRLSSRKITELTVALARKLGLRATSNVKSLALDARLEKWVTALARDLDGNRGQSVILVGDQQPVLVHAIAHTLNQLLGNVGKTVRYVEPFDVQSDGPAELVRLSKLIEEKKVTAAVVLGGNPVFNGPSDARLAERFAGLEESIYLGTEVNETAKAVKWHLPRAHFLEQWSDVRAVDGTYSIVQPLIAPMYEGRSDAELVWMLAGKPQRAYDIVQASARTLFGPEDFDRRWRRALHDGVWAASELPAVEVQAANQDHLDGLWIDDAAGGLEVTFHPDPHAWDGRFANNAWMQELPDPMWKGVWGNVALFSEKTMKARGLAEGDVIKLVAKGAGSADVVVQHGPGQADDSVAVTIGQGRRVVGRVGHGVGTDTTGLRTSRGWGMVTGVDIVRRDGSAQPIRTQEHFQMENRGVARAGSLDEYAKDPEFARKQNLVPIPNKRNLWGEPWQYTGHAWAMAIDLHTCVGCNACVVACQAENNIPVVGPENVAKSREMHWIRIDRYFEGTSDDNVQSYSQAMTCQHCENAPCEQVCPVAATTHSPEGLNDMVYNRCIGTKYCLNNCPFKVRRFNYFNYTKDTPQTRQLQYNPDVTVRSRGVMEKCTYCVQRINAAKIEAHARGEERVKDGAIVTACAQACPTHAITFGDINDKTSEIARVIGDPRAYKLLEEINVRARGTYLAKIRNLNPELA